MKLGWLTVGAAVAAAGCGGGDPGPRPKSEPKPKAEAKAPDEREIRMERGSATRIAPGSLDQKLWDVQWQSAQVRIVDERVGGSMQSVRGTIYQNGAARADFSADRGSATPEGDELKLEGNVRVVSREPRAELRCERLAYDPKLARLRAEGTVRITNDLYTVGPFPTLWATPDLKRVGTPDTFPTR